MHYRKRNVITGRWDGRFWTHPVVIFIVVAAFAGVALLKVSS